MKDEWDPLKYKDFSSSWVDPSLKKNVAEGSCSCLRICPDYLDNWREACNGSGQTENGFSD